MSGLKVELEFLVAKGDWMTSNMRDHWRAKAAKTQRVRQRAHLETRSHMNAFRVPGFTNMVFLTVDTFYRSGPGLDDDNSQPTVKAIRDGMVDAGLLIDDKPKYVAKTIYQASQKDPSLPVGCHRIVIQVEEVGEEE